MIPDVGAPLDRFDGKKKVTGGAKYAAENQLENAAYGVLVMSTIPAGTIRSIDDRAARKSAGVIEVISHINSPKMQKPKGGSLRETELIPFTDNSVHYVGQRIAIVVADTLEHATRGAELVKVTYDETPARIDIDKLKSEANDRAKSAFTKGDADTALANAAVRVDQVYRTPHEHHNPMEAHSCIAAWNGEHLTLYDSSQNIFGGQQALAQMFGIPKENVHVMSLFVGGAFGSKGGLWPHVPIAAVAARVVQRPVKVVVTRKQLFFGNGHRPECVQHVALGANNDGKLVALIHDGYSQSNDVCDYAERFTRPTHAAYAVDNMKLVNPVVSLNLPSPTFMRAPGENPGMFAIESAMDELAYALKMDPLQLRLVNHADVAPDNGKPWSSKSLKECYSQAAEKFGWSKRSPEPRSMRSGRDLIGFGMATATYPSHRSPASARAVMKADGTVTVACGTHEMGMGTATVMAQLAAETLGIPVERVRFEYGDTSLPNAPISAGSMTVSSVGTAVFEVCNALKKRIAELGEGDDYHTILAKHYLDSVEASVDSKPPQEEQYAGQAFGAHFVEVAIDEDIPVVRVQRMVSAFAGGRILNEKTARSQYYGGIIQGIGMALLEETHLDKRLGTYTNVNFAEYMVPTNADIRSIDIILVPEEDQHVNPIGAKGIGEIGIVGVAPAIANAVYHATGKRVRDLPITIEKLM
ncbi:MAG TPA: xanthine dehydrogenase family protein molybdopterin-binding subunit [Thermoanaerobaculia bacterium]|nr:xanthine dehydrogenase family protein molybdopterin-binding subunit [Thermoanaerobaculia bacterium]